jgi:circadian clock protein KaiC
MSAVTDLISSGVPGLDAVLGGGLRGGHLYFVEGAPGTGKTTLGLQFALAGVRSGEVCLFVALAETIPEIEQLAGSHGWDLDGLVVRDLAESGQMERASLLFDLSEVALEERVQALLEEIESLKPQRLVLDALGALRVMSDHPGEFRRHVALFCSKAIELGCTLIATDHPQDADERHPRSLAWGIVCLEQRINDYGPVQRRLWVPKMRAQSFPGGYHDFRIAKGGLVVFPRVRAGTGAREPAQAPVSTQISELDALLGGGLQRGTSAALIGPAGCGKSTLACTLGLAATARGERAVYYLFDELVETFRSRAASQALDLDGPLGAGLLVLRRIDVGELSPGELAHELAREVEQHGAKLIVIDSLNGLLQAMPDERFLGRQMHEVLSFLSATGTLSIVTMAQASSPMGPAAPSLDLSYLADAVIAQRYFEAKGHLRYAISVLKKRYGDHERTIREYQIGTGGIRLGEPLADFRGVLSGTPEYVGEARPLLRRDLHDA